MPKSQIDVLGIKVMLDLDYEKVSSGGKPYDQFLGGIKSQKTKRNYCKNIQRFLDEIPDSIYLKV